MKIIFMMTLLLSDSYAFSYQMMHSLSVLYPVTYLALSLALLSLPVFRE